PGKAGTPPSAGGIGGAVLAPHVQTAGPVLAPHALNLAERPHFGRRQVARLPEGQIAQADGTEGHASEPQHAVAESFAVALDLVFPSLREGEMQAAPQTPPRHDVDGKRSRRAVVEFHASTPAGEIRARHAPLHIRLVDAAEPVTWMQQPVRE